MNLSSRRDRGDAGLDGGAGRSEERRCSPPETGGTLQWGGFNCRNNDWYVIANMFFYRNPFI